MQNCIALVFVSQRSCCDISLEGHVVLVLLQRRVEHAHIDRKVLSNVCVQQGSSWPEQWHREPGTAPASPGGIPDYILALRLPLCIQGYQDLGKGISYQGCM